MKETRLSPFLSLISACLSRPVSMCELLSWIEQRLVVELILFWLFLGFQKKAQATPILVSVSGLIENFRRVCQTFSYGSHSPLQREFQLSWPERAISVEKRNLYKNACLKQRSKFCQRLHLANRKNRRRFLKSAVQNLIPLFQCLYKRMGLQTPF